MAAPALLRLRRALRLAGNPALDVALRSGRRSYPHPLVDLAAGRTRALAALRTVTFARGG